MNRVELIGRITKDAELRYTASNTAVSKFTIAINRNYKNEEQETDFISCTAFGKRAEMIGKYCKKGTQVAIEGSIRTGSYEKDGKKYYTTDVNIDSIQLLGSKPKEELKAEETKTEKKVEEIPMADSIFEAFGNTTDDDGVAF